MTKSQLDTIIGKNIRKLRKSRGLSTGELSKLLGLSQSALGLIENGARGTTAHKLWRLSVIFDHPIDNLFH